jgi:hypothetical protein
MNLIGWQTLKNDLEELVDKHGLGTVLGALDSVCLEKADWVESAESIGAPDRVLGRTWRSCARAIGRVVDGPASRLP